MLNIQENNRISLYMIMDHSMILLLIRFLAAAAKALEEKMKVSVSV